MVDLRVSIPKRVSEALKRLGIADNRISEIVSIPKRVSEALKLKSAYTANVENRRFNP